MLENILGLEVYYVDYRAFLYALISSSMALFAVIDVLGGVPLFLYLRNKYGEINSKKSILTATIILISFLFIGKYILNLIGLDIASFSVAGSILFVFFAVELILGISLFKYSEQEGRSMSIVPIAFPILSGPGSFAILLSLKANNSYIVIIVALILNMAFAYLVLTKTKHISKLLGPAGIGIVRRVFGIILLAIAVKMFVTNVHVLISDSKLMNRVEKIEVTD